MRHPREMGAAEVAAFLTHLAVDRQVSASTQNQAKSAILYLYKSVLQIDLPWLDEVVQAVGDRLDVMIDGGIQRGTHVLKALSLGAKVVGLGRFYLFALAAAGQSQALEGRVTISASDADSALGSLRFSKIAGPDWISVDPLTG